MSCVSPPEGMMLLALAMLVSLALCVPRRPVLHRSAALVVSLLYGKRLTKLGCTTQLGPGLGAAACVSGGHWLLLRWSPCPAPWHRAASPKGAGVVSSRCGLFCGRADS